MASEKKSNSQIEIKKIKKPEKERDTWTGKFDFFLSALGYAGEEEIFFNYSQTPITLYFKFQLAWVLYGVFHSKIFLL